MVDIGRTNTGPDFDSGIFPSYPDTDRCRQYSNNGTADLRTGTGIIKASSPKGTTGVLAVGREVTVTHPGTRGRERNLWHIRRHPAGV